MSDPAWNIFIAVGTTSITGSNQISNTILSNDNSTYKGVLDLSTTTVANSFSDLTEDVTLQFKLNNSSDGSKTTTYIQPLTLKQSLIK